MVLILLVGMMVPAGAAGTPTLSISSGEVKAGEDVTLTVSIKDNPGIAAMKLYVYFDTTVFTTASITALGNFKENGNIMKNTIASAKENGRYTGNLAKDGAIALWYNSNGEDVSSNGSVLSIKLRANSDVKNGEYHIELGYSASDSCNSSGNEISFITKSGVVSLSGGTANLTEEEQSTKETPEFVDISDHWAESYIRQSAEIGLVDGYGDGIYGPNDRMTRGQFVTILWRNAGCPEPKGKSSFKDLEPHMTYYHKAVAWAEENGVVNGMAPGIFEPNGQVTREQLVTILHRLAGTPIGEELMFTGIYDTHYSDSAQIGSWAKQAVYWAVYEGIYCGRNSVEVGTTLAPKSPANRAQIAVMMINYLNKQ